MTLTRARVELAHLVLFVVTLLLPAAALAGDPFLSGHLKYQLTHSGYDADSIFAELDARDTTDHSLDMRILARQRWSAWDAEVHYQMFGVYGDTVQVARRLPVSPLFVNTGPISDQRRLFDLTAVIDEGSQHFLVHRLDRASVGYSSESLVLRAGRHIVSWGNGLLFNPLDIFNPFDPTAIDKDYKTGDDMAYAQWLTASGDDLQAVLIPRRDPATGNLESEQSSLALKYHATRGPRDVDLLLAEHYGDSVAGAGIAMDWGGAVVRGDITGAWSEGDFTPSAVASVSHAWLWWGHNVTGFIEYYYNGFGQADGNYAPSELLHNSALLDRIARGEVYNLARNYLAASATVEMTPLLLAVPALFLNLDDGSALLQLIVNYDIRQDLNLLAGFNLPLGPNNTEFGGIPLQMGQAGNGEIFAGPGVRVFAKLAVFF